MEFSFLWFIENYSYCGLNRTSDLVSPEFTPKGLGGTSWTLFLNPRSLRRGFNNSILLKRNANDAGPENVVLKLEISVMKADGSILYSEECEHAFRKGAERGFKASVDVDELYVRRNTEYLPQDTLGICCRILKGEGGVHKVVECTARTIIATEKICFLHRVENFSAFKKNEKKILQIPSLSKTGCAISSTLCIQNRSANIDMIVVDIVPSRSNYVLCRKKLSFLSESGNIIVFGEVDYRFRHTTEQIRQLQQRFSRGFILSKRNELLPNDELSLLCECIFYTKEEIKIEAILYDTPMMSYKNRFYRASTAAEKLSFLRTLPDEIKVNHRDQYITNADLKTFITNNNAPQTRPLVAFNRMGENDPYYDKYNAAEKLSACTSVHDDFKALYNDQFLTDIVLKTATKSFSAHKNVLYARSSVFRATLTNDMKEKNTDCIKVEDLEDETVQRLLLFLYTDNLEELQWESAIQLYYAADKYAIGKLKVLCSSFLIDNLNTSTASRILLLADNHNDTELKRIVEDFILEHEREVFGSEEWEKLIETNPQLVIKTMHLKYKREKVGK
ncbi:unnamed protein product [Larinioides sclopetarius]|uniref:Uncharacterized protein n=1 Tax=Larinioides sclopetarius TaxID=280406 RepID=A0AAV2ACV5_9ARAC